MTVPGSSPPVASQLPDWEWDMLTTLVREGCVVPVIGPELLIFRKEGREKPLYDVWARALAEQEGLPIPKGSPPSSLLYQVTNELSQRLRPNDLAYKIDHVVERRAWPIAEPLRKLAEISSFSLYVTTTIDHLLQKALEEAPTRRRQTVQEFKFMPEGKKPESDLPKDFGDSDAPSLFYLFGACSNTPGTFAGTEDDLIEFSWSLLDKDGQSPDFLFSYLKAKTVLLLGCNFPDWLGRFFIRALEQSPHEEKINIYYVSEHCEAGLAHYLERRHAHVLTEQSPVAFVDELYRRWSQYKESGVARPKATDVLPPFKSGAVFLSYAHEDHTVAKVIRDQLEANDIDTWMDDREFKGGEEFEPVIRENIKHASFFVAIISRSLDRLLPEGRFVLKEWKWAEDASEARHKDECFLQPVVIDDTPPAASFVDLPYRELHWNQLSEGALPQEFIDRLRRGIRNYKRSEYRRSR